MNYRRRCRERKKNDSSDSRSVKRQLQQPPSTQPVKRQLQQHAAGVAVDDAGTTATYEADEANDAPAADAPAADAPADDAPAADDPAADDAPTADAPAADAPAADAPADDHADDAPAAAATNFVIFFYAGNAIRVVHASIRVGGFNYLLPQYILTPPRAQPKFVVLVLRAAIPRFAQLHLEEL